MALIAAGCLSLEVKQVKTQAPLEVSPEKKSRPIQIGRILIKASRGEVVGQVQSGPLCLPRGSFLWRGTGRGSASQEYVEILFQELTKANYQVVGDPDALFEDPSTWKAEYVLAGLILTINQRNCYLLAEFPFFDRLSAKGEAFLKVEWHLYSQLDRRVVRRIVTEGSARRDSLARDEGVDILMAAFVAAIKNLLAAPDFHRLLTGTVALADPAAVKASHPPLVIPARPSDLTPLAQKIVLLRAGVVTVFAGPSQGSGFFVTRSGLLLTNEHVVGGAKFVKLRLLSGREILGEVLRTDPRRDVALVKAEEGGMAALPISLAPPALGDEVFALGSPLSPAYSATLTRGIVSAFRNYQGLKLIQSDVTIHHGSSGGPLLDRTGSVIGLSVSGAERHGVAANLNFFIPAASALSTLNISLGPMNSADPVPAGPLESKPVPPRPAQGPAPAVTAAPARPADQAKGLMTPTPADPAEAESFPNRLKWTEIQPVSGRLAEAAEYLRKFVPEGDKYDWEGVLADLIRGGTGRRFLLASERLIRLEYLADLNELRILISGR